MLEMISLSLHFEALETLDLPPFAGSTLRGALGGALKASSCVRASEGCDRACGLPGTCSYGFLMETPVPQGAPARIRRSAYAPHPMLIEPFDGGMVFPKDTLTAKLHLFGPARRHLRPLLAGFSQLGHLGMGRGRGKLALFDVRDLTSGGSLMRGGALEVSGITAHTVGLEAWAQAPTKLRVHFETPVQLMRQGKMVERLDFSELIYQCASRLEVMAHCHGSFPEDARQPRDWSTLARQAHIELYDQDLMAVEFERWSSRQQRKHPLRGLSGHLDLSGDLQPFMPLLKAASMLAIGKGTSFGLGQIRLEVIE